VRFLGNHHESNESFIYAQKDKGVPPVLFGNMTAGEVYLALVAIIILAARRLEKRISLPGFQT
jgi:hypothetical protein